MKKTKLAVSGLAALTLVAATAGCGSSGGANNQTGGDNGKVTLQFLQNKREAVDEFNKLIKEFEQQNPNIHVVQVNPPDADTTLKTDMTKNQLPDVIAMGGDAVFAEMAQAGVLHDFSDDSALQDIHPEYMQMLKALTNTDKPYGIPYTTNAQTILYNKDLFDKLGLSIPKTWNELISEAKQIKAKGQTPFYFGFKDAWTTMIPWNSLAANLHGDNFFADLKAGNTSFSKAYPQVVDRMVELASYGQQNQFGVGYDQANAAFAKGESVFYVQGIWAIPAILKDNPNMHIGAFVFPATDDPSQNKLVSGIDTVLTISDSTKHEAEAEKFVHFLLEKQNAEDFINNQKLFSAVKGVEQKDPMLTEVEKYIADGKVVDFPDHYYPPAMQIANLVQGMLVKKEDKAAFLQKLDNEYKKAESHQ
jgi:raffinose/stachyose/melibiose transport system substrate-binding protein